MYRKTALFAARAIAFAGVFAVMALSQICVASAASRKARPGVDTPRPGAVITQRQVRVVVRPPAGARGLRVHLGSRDVTGRFRRVGRSRLVGVLTRRQGLRYGWNEVSVLTGRARNRSVAEASSFVFARRAPRLARLVVRPGTVTSLTVVGGSARRVRRVSVQLNGRRVTRALDTSNPGRWRTELSVTHGLRYGLNGLRVLVVEPDRGRYVVLSRRFRVPRGQHLAGAGWDVAASPGVRVRLDGRSSRASGGGRLTYRWRLISKPRGSRARLRGAGSVRPVFTPDRPGHYLIRLRVARRGGSLSRGDTVSATVGPDDLRVPFKGLTTNASKQWGIQVGDHFYANPDGVSLQWLTLDRATLEPTGDGNVNLDGSAASIDRLESQLNNNEQLVVLSFPLRPVGFGHRAIAADQIDRFKKVLVEKLGVDLGSLDALFTRLISGGDEFSVVGVPTGGKGSGWFVVGETSNDALTGFLMPSASFNNDNAQLFRLQPERPEFDTSVTKTATTNTMLLGRQHREVSLPAGATGGFQVVAFDGLLNIYSSQVFATNGVDVAGREAALNAMATYLRTHKFFGIAIQSIGTVAVPPSPANHEDRPRFGWYRVGTALSGLGGNPHTFNTVNGSYAFVGTAWLEKDEVADSSTAVPNDREAGTLRGRLSMRHDGILAPIVADAQDALEFRLFDYVFQDPQPWPFTRGWKPGPSDPTKFSDAEAPAYAKALAYITDNLSGGAYTSWAPDLRQAYAGAPAHSWSDAKVDLLRLPYPGDGTTCGQNPGSPKPPDPGYTREQFCTLSDELQREFGWLDAIKTNLFDPYRDVLIASSSIQHADLQALGKQIREAIKPPDTAKVLWSIGQFVGDLIGIFTPEGKAKEAVEALVSVYELTRDMVDESDGTTSKPVGDQVDAKVEDLDREVAEKVADSANALVAIRQVIDSDYGRLKALGSVANSRDWSVNDAELVERLRNTSRASFASVLMPVAYGVHALQRRHASWELTEADGISCRSFGAAQAWVGTPDSVQIAWMGNFDRDGYQGWWPTRLALGQHYLSYFGNAYPPAELADKMFKPIEQGGYGMQLPRFMWEQYAKGFPPTDIYVC